MRRPADELGVADGPETRLLAQREHRFDNGWIRREREQAPEVACRIQKYGSRPAGWSVRDSQCWRTDALVESTKKGSPIVPASNSSSHPSGLPSGGVTDPAWIMKGSTAAGAASTTA